MNREIKFRMWNNVKSDPQKSKMFYDLENVFECLKQQMAWDSHDVFTLQYNHVGDGSVFMQFTGLLDKNGKEIYEGDICQIMRRKQDGFSKEGLITVGVVRFSTVYAIDNTLYAFDTFNINDRSLRYLLNNDLEIIGNIYENKIL